MTSPLQAALPHEATELHTRLLKCALEVEETRAYWQHCSPDQSRLPPTVLATRAFTDYWFGARSLSRIEVLLSNFRARFDAFAPSLEVLHAWSVHTMDPSTRRAICHWHLQLSDPLYRSFTGEFLARRRASHRPDITRDVVLAWVVQADAAGRWTTASHVQFASKLLSAAYSAGLVASNRDPRPLALPLVPDDALAYLLQLLRGVTFAGTFLDNPYTASVGLDPTLVEERLRQLPILRFRRQADLVDFDWAYPDLRTWVNARTQGTAA